MTLSHFTLYTWAKQKSSDVEVYLLHALVIQNVGKFEMTTCSSLQDICHHWNFFILQLFCLFCLTIGTKLNMLYVSIFSELYYLRNFFFFFGVGCVWREKVSRGKRERIILIIILLGSLYYFIGLYVKIKARM